MSKDYPYQCVMRFKTEDDLVKFINFWLSRGGDEACGMTTVCDDQQPSWYEDPPAIYAESLSPEETHELYSEAPLRYRRLDY